MSEGRIEKFIIMAIQIKDYVKICPKCGSNHINSFTQRYTVGTEIYNDNCKACGYKGIFPEVNKSKIEEFRKEIQKIN